MPVQEKLHYCNSSQEAGACIKERSRGRTAESHEKLLPPPPLSKPDVEAEDGSWGSNDVSVFEEVCRK